MSAKRSVASAVLSKLYVQLFFLLSGNPVISRKWRTLGAFSASVLLLLVYGYLFIAITIGSDLSPLRSLLLSLGAVASVAGFVLQCAGANYVLRAYAIAGLLLLFLLLQSTF